MRLSTPMMKNGFFDSVVFSDDGVDQTRIHISASAKYPYLELPPRGKRNDPQPQVTVTVIDQYGRPVRGQGVHAVSDAPLRESNASPDNTLRFQNWYVTRRDGTYPITYGYTGGIRIENLTVLNTGSPKTVDPNATDDQSEQRNPPASARIYWVVDGVQPASPEAGYSAVDDVPAMGDYLVIDTDNNTLVVYQDAVEDNEATPRSEAQDLGPHQYFWYANDRFTVGTDAVTMEQFEAIVGGGTDDNKVTVGNISWENYRYFTHGLRARWTVAASCTEGVAPEIQ